MLLPLACLKRYFLKVLQGLSEFVQYHQSIKSPPQWSVAKFRDPSICIVVLVLGIMLVAYKLGMFENNVVNEYQTTFNNRLCGKKTLMAWAMLSKRPKMFNEISIISMLKYILYQACSITCDNEHENMHIQLVLNRN